MPRIPDIDNNTDDQIDFLVTRKYRHLSVAKRMEDPEVDAYRRTLIAQSPAKIKQRVEIELAAIREERKAEEANRWFNNSSYAAEVEHWSACSYWTIDEGVALLMDKDPRHVTWEAIKSSTHISTVAKRYEAIRDLASRARVAKILGELTVPGVFIRWAERSGIDAHQSFARRSLLATSRSLIGKICMKSRLKQ